jgi:hypothetical protein
MFPTELEIHQRRKDLEREAQNHRLAGTAREPRPSLAARVTARLTAFSARPAALEPNPEARYQTEAIA